MKYLCMAYYHPEKMAALAPAELKALVSQCPPRDEKLWKSGAMLLGASLGGPEQAFSIRPRAGKPMLTDGPYTGAKELVGGFFIIEAQDREEAIRLASMHPAAELGEDVGWGIEIFPIGHFQQAQ
ncbi:MAG: YciI family protein [Pseudomonadota bacterium]|nr:YciI family protein [Pseudomonadota bacterium]